MHSRLRWIMLTNYFDNTWRAHLAVPLSKISISIEHILPITGLSEGPSAIVIAVISDVPTIPNCLLEYIRVQTQLLKSSMISDTSPFEVFPQHLFSISCGITLQMPHLHQGKFVPGEGPGSGSDPPKDGCSAVGTAGAIQRVVSVSSSSRLSSIIRRLWM